MYRSCSERFLEERYVCIIYRVEYFFEERQKENEEESTVLCTPLIFVEVTKKGARTRIDKEPVYMGTVRLL